MKLASNEPVMAWPAKQGHGSRALGGVRVPLPGEHGAWFMLFTCLALGTVVGGRPALATIPYAVSTFFTFALREPLYLVARARSEEERRAMRSWAAGFGAAALASGALAALAFGRWLLIPLGAMAAVGLAGSVYLRKRRLGRTVAGELADLVLLTAVAPGAYYVSVGDAWLPQTFVALWLLTYLYYGGTVFYVKLKATQAVVKPAGFLQKLALGWQALAYQGLAIAVVYALRWLNGDLELAYMAFLPGFVKVCTGTLHAPRRVNFKQVGYTEVLMATIFAAIIVIAFRA